MRKSLWAHVAAHLCHRHGWCVLNITNRTRERNLRLPVWHVISVYMGYSVYIHVISVYIIMYIYVLRNCQFTPFSEKCEYYTIAGWQCCMERLWAISKHVKKKKKKKKLEFPQVHRDRNWGISTCVCFFLITVQWVGGLRVSTAQRTVKVSFAWSLQILQSYW